jgi:hypothetical protein
MSETPSVHYAASSGTIYYISMSFLELAVRDGNCNWASHSGLVNAVAESHSSYCAAAAQRPLSSPEAWFGDAPYLQIRPGAPLAHDLVQIQIYGIDELR